MTRCYLCGRFMKWLTVGKDLDGYWCFNDRAKHYLRIQCKYYDTPECKEFLKSISGRLDAFCNGHKFVNGEAKIFKVSKCPIRRNKK